MSEESTSVESTPEVAETTQTTEVQTTGNEAVPTTETTVPEGTEQVNPATGLTPTEEFELKINGQAIKYKKEDVLTAAQKFYAGEDKLKEAALLQKNVIDTLKNKPWEVMEKLGLDPDKLAHDRLYEKIRRERLTPEQKELEDLRNKQKEWEEMQKSQEQREQEAQHLQVVESHKNAVASSILEELPKATDLPQTSDSVVKIIGKMKEALSFGKQITVPQAIEMLRRDREDTAKWLAQADPELVRKLIGAEKLQQISKAEIDAVKSMAADNRAKGTKQAPKPAPEPAKKQTHSEWLAERERARYGSN